MFLLIDIVLITLLSLIVYQDFKSRAISWILLPLLIGLLFYKGLAIMELKSVFYFGLFNLSFVIVHLLILTIYMSVKNRRITNIIDTYIGLGDILLFVVLCFAFSPFNFIFFFVISILITIISVLVYKLITKNEYKEIPLAGAQSMLMILILVYSNVIHPVQLYNDSFLLQILIPA